MPNHKKPTISETLSAVQTKLNTVKRFQARPVDRDHSVAVLLEAVSDLAKVVTELSENQQKIHRVLPASSLGG